MLLAEKNQKAHIKHQVSKTKQALERFEQIKQKVAREKKFELKNTLE